MSARARHSHRARFEVVVVGAGGERQNVCFGERYETREEAELAYDTLVADGEIDASARIVEAASWIEEES